MATEDSSDDEKVKGQIDQEESTDLEEEWTTFQSGGASKRNEWALNNDLKAKERD